MVIALGIVFGFYFSLSLGYSLLISLSLHPVSFDRSQKISIIIAARDEEEKIGACLQSLFEMDYPVENLEIWIGDDASEDKTAEIVKTFIKDKPHFHYFRVEEQWEGLHGKQNVLAQLAHKTQGDYLLVTDADIIVGKNWAAGLMGAFEKGVGMVSGPTLVEGKSLWGRMQSFDWIVGIMLNRAHTLLGIPLTGVGNNMAILKKAYFEAGGYENISFSVTEDYKLFKVLCEQGPWRFKMLLHPAVTNLTYPIKGLQGWIDQRRRWFKGGLEIAWYNLMLFFLNTLFVPAWVLSFFFLPFGTVMILLGGKVLADFFLQFTATNQLKRLHWLLWFPVWEIYYQLMSLILPVLQLAPGKVHWKGRRY